MRGLRDLGLKSVYRTDYDNLLEDFYLPVLSVATRYDRAVGFFSAGMLSAAAQGLSAFIQNDGQMRLIVGAELDPETERAALRGMELAEVGHRIEEHLMAILDRVGAPLIHRRFELLTYLIASGRLELKVALRRRGMYHEKIGVVYDGEGDFVVFQGSLNETPHAMLPQFNFESINVFPGWRPDLSSHVQPHLSAFDTLWGGGTPNTVVVRLPEAIRSAWYAKAPLRNALLEPDGESELGSRARTEFLDPVAPSLPAVPEVWNGRPFSIRDHQRQALEAWQRYSFQSVFALATGAGKTVTAIYGAVKLFEGRGRLAIVVSVPYQALADQWVSEFNRFKVFPHRCYESTARWWPGFSAAVRSFGAGESRFLCAVVVNRTLKSDGFQEILADIPGAHLLFIGDECHHHGSLGFLGMLPDHAQFRMGLSATPEHYLDDEANRRLGAYFGSSDDEDLRFSLAQALESGTLTPYEYRVVPVCLDPDELETYVELSRKIAQSMAAAEDGAVSGGAGQLMGQRARVLALANNKISTLIQLVRGRLPEALTLFYVGEGDVVDARGEGMRMVERVSVELDKLGWAVARFTAEEGRRERVDILHRFSHGLVDGLVAMRCLDEGIDLPACGTAYILASSRNPRQFIQRRGRVLRKAPGKEMAKITDFVVLPALNSQVDRRTQRRLVGKELERVWEFAHLSLNPQDAVRALQPYIDEYKLQHLVVGDGRQAGTDVTSS